MSDRYKDGGRASNLLFEAVEQAIAEGWNVGDFQEACAAAWEQECRDKLKRDIESWVAIVDV